MNKISLCGLTVEEIFRIIQPEGFNYNHALAITNAIYKKRISDFSRILNVPKKLKVHLAEIAIPGYYGPIASEISTDKTVKYLFRNPEGKQFETVYIPDGKRNTVCISTQSGCRMGCPFCVTAKYGFHGNLSAGDIINQIISIPPDEKVTHVVFMGMGEPMDNLENVLKATGIISAEWGMAISPRNITVSTVGILPAVRLFLEKSRCNLTLSLYSPFEDERISVIPAEKKYPAVEIIEIMKEFLLKKKMRLSIAYVMIKNVNDTDRHLTGLKKMLADSGIRVNLLPYHPVKNDDNASSSDDKMHYFKHNLVISGISASVRKSRGTDISAACGLLATGLKHELT
jgi:23S rRNA (adenine2503-C2)-methyltransferase